MTIKEKQLIKSLLLMKKRQYKINEKLEELLEALSFTSGEIDNGVEDLVLDILGFPADNTLEKKFTDPDVYCRDHLTDIIFKFDEDEIGLDDAIYRLEEKTKELPIQKLI